MSARTGVCNCIVNPFHDRKVSESAKRTVYVLKKNESEIQVGITNIQTGLSLKQQRMPQTSCNTVPFALSAALAPKVNAILGCADFTESRVSSDENTERT